MCHSAEEGRIAVMKIEVTLMRMSFILLTEC